MADIDTWKRFVEEGDKLYNYMIDNFNHMIDGDSIKHFDVEFGPYHMIEYIDDIKEKYYYDIQKEIIPWIHKEGKDLFDYNNWIPFRDKDVLTTMLLAYRKMFQFKQYIFQLTMRSECDNEECNNCNIGESRITKHFGVALYGWIEENKINIQPRDIITLLEDNIMPDKYWYWERKYCTGR